MTLSLFSTPTKSVWMTVTDSISSSVPRRYFCLCLIGHSAGIWPESHFWRLAMHPWNFPERNTLHSHSTLSVFAQDYVGRFHIWMINSISEIWICIVSLVNWKKMLNSIRHEEFMLLVLLRSICNCHKI